MSDTIQSYPPPILKERRDPENLISGRSMVLFREPYYSIAELLTIKLRGRRSLPPERFFRENKVIAFEMMAEFDTPLKGGWFLRRVIVEPKGPCNLIHVDHFIEPNKKSQFLLPDFRSDEVTPVRK